MLFSNLIYKINDPLEEMRLDMGIFYKKMLRITAMLKMSLFGHINNNIMIMIVIDLFT